MTSVVAGEEREQAIRWIEEGRSVLGMINGILNDYDRLRAAAEAAERERDRLQEMVNELERVRSLAETLQRDCEQLRAERGQLEAEKEQTHKEREDIAQWFTSFMNEAVSRLRTQQVPS